MENVDIPRVELESGPPPMSVKIFLSTVSDEFKFYREQLRADLTRPNVDVKAAASP